MNSNFKQVWVCSECESQFKDKPLNDQCPVCIEIAKINILIKKMNSQKDFRLIKQRINAMSDSIEKFDLYGKINKLRKERKIQR